MHNFIEFIDYVYSFYGKGGLYDQKPKKEQIAYALFMYLDRCNDAMDDWDWGDGDSLDRERVRDIMNEIYGPNSCHRHCSTFRRARRLTHVV